MLSVSKPASSLVQQKKQQWAREREEMSHLYLPWGASDRYGNRLQVRNQFASSIDLSDQSSYEYQDPMKRQRSPSLPPIHHNDQPKIVEDTMRSKDVLNRNISTAKRFSFYDEDGEGDTSGYGSETVNHRSKSGALHDVTNNHDPTLVWHQQSDDRRNPLSGSGRSGEDLWSGRSPRSISGEEGRPRWGDRGVATGRLWEPTAPNERLPQMPNQKKGTPSWVERGLNMIENTSEVLMIDQTSSNNSGVECDRFSCNGSDEGRTFLRGQNVPLEPEIKAQRANQRMKALELQSAIKNQLEDREKRRQEEREIKLREEKLEELRLQRQLEEDRQRMEQEKRKNHEKQLLEQRKLETLKKALEDAERSARQDKEKRFTLHKQNIKVNIPVETTLQPQVDEQIEEEMVRQNENISPTKSSRTYDVNSPKSQNVQSNKDFNSHHTTECNSPRSLSAGNLNLYIHSVPPISLTDSQNQFSILPLGINGNLGSCHHNGIQLAVLVPQSRNNTSSMCNVSLNSLSNFNDTSEYGKVLTPRKYRSTRNKDACTQTDTGLFKCTAVDQTNETDDILRNIDKNYSNIDENAPQDSHHNIIKKDRRFRSEERYKKDLENRPKWGVNRPAAQYKKQSEKDPFYSQKRKLRLKHRTQTRQYMSQSSEDSRSPSPLTRSDRINDNAKPRNSVSQSYWRSKRSSQDLLKQEAPDTSSLSQTEQSYDALSLNDIDNKKSPSNSINMSPSKRLTLSQKFINDKYGNRKLWVDEGIKQKFVDNDNRKKILDQINMAKRDSLEQNDDQDFFVKTKF